MRTTRADLVQLIRTSDFAVLRDELAQHAGRNSPPRFAALWSAFSSLFGPHWLLVAVTVSLSLVGIVLWGTLVGSVLPFILRRLGFDPATSSAPILATLVDVTGLVIYCSIGYVVLRGTLL